MRPCAGYTQPLHARLGRHSQQTQLEVHKAWLADERGLELRAGAYTRRYVTPKTANFRVYLVGDGRADATAGPLSVW